MKITKNQLRRIIAEASEKWKSEPGAPLYGLPKDPTFGGHDGKTIDENGMPTQFIFADETGQVNVRGSIMNPGDLVKLAETIEDLRGGKIPMPAGPIAFDLR